MAGFTRGMVLASLVACAASLAACNGNGRLPPIPEMADNAYVLGPGDRLKISVFGREEASGEFTVGADGRVATPLVGEIKASGLTLARLQDSYRGELQKNGFYKDPKLAIEVLNYRPFFIMGEVRKPGSFPYSSGLTIGAAVAQAGGYTYHADKDLAVVERRSAEGAILRGRAAAGTQIMPDDIITVPESIF